jgi:WD40 repeat protein
LGSEKPIPFEFLVNGSYLRTSIDEYLTSNGISAETTLNVEYVRALIPPLHVASFIHDDWVSAVDVLSGSSPAGSWVKDSNNIVQGQEHIVSAGYDGFLRIWNMSSEVLATSPSEADGGHIGAVKAVKLPSPTSLVSSGIDRTVRLWKYVESGGGFSGSITPQIEFSGHKATVDTVAVHAPSHRLLSASADHSVGLWSTKKSESPEAPS